MNFRKRCQSLEKGGVMLYVLAIAVSVGIGISMVARQVGQSYVNQRKSENATIARYAAEAAIANEESATNLAQVPSAGSYSTTFNSVPVSLSSTLTDQLTSDLQIERVSATAQFRGANVNVTRELGNKRIDTFRQWNYASQVLGSDQLVDSKLIQMRGTGAPDWRGPRLLATNGISAALTFYDFNLPREFGATKTAFDSSTLPSNSRFDLAIFVPADTTPDFANLSVELVRGTTRTRITNLNTQGSNVSQTNYTAANYNNQFFTNNSPTGFNNGWVILIDIDPYSNGTTIKNGTGNVQVSLFYPSPTTASSPRIDTVAFMGTTETETKTGLLAEYSSTLSNGYWPWGNAWDHSPDFCYAKRIEQTPDIAMGSDNYAHIVGADSQYWHVNYSGWFTVPTTGNYRFSTNGWADNGIWYYLNNQLVFSSQNGFNPGINLTAGQVVPIWIESFDGGGWYGTMPLYNVNGGGWTAFANTTLSPGFGSDLIYLSNFNDGTSTGWTWNRIRTASNGVGPSGISTPINGISTMPGARTKTGANVNAMGLGDFGDVGNFAQISFPNVARGQIILYCDVLMIQSWDGHNAWGPDQMVIRANGTDVFNNVILANNNTQGFTGSGSWRYRRNGWNGYNRQVMNTRLEFYHNGGPLTLRFSSEGPQIQGINDESWALDNVHIRRKRETNFE